MCYVTRRKKCLLIQTNKSLYDSYYFFITFIHADKKEYLSNLIISFDLQNYQFPGDTNKSDGF